MEEKEYFVYLLRCKNNFLYTGITTCPERRFMEHSLKQKEGAKFTKSHLALNYVAIFGCVGRSKASKLKYRIKKLKKSKKRNL